MATQSETDIGIQQFRGSGKEIMQNLSPQMKKQLGVYIQILQKRQRLQQTSLLKGTILADKIRPKQMFSITIKILVAIITLIYFLNIFLPKPLKVETSYIQHNQQTGQQCTQKTCDSYIDYIQEMEIKRLSPLNRKLEVYLELDQNQFKRYDKLYRNVENQTLVQQIEKVEIFKTLKQGQEIAQRINLIEGDEIIEQIVDGKPMYYAGDIHVIDSPSFLIRIVKRTRKPLLPIVVNNDTPTVRLLQDTNQQNQGQGQQLSQNIQNKNLQTDNNQQQSLSQQNQQTQQQNQISVTQQTNQSPPPPDNTSDAATNNQSQQTVQQQNQLQPSSAQSQNNTQPIQPTKPDKSQNQTSNNTSPQPAISQQKQSFPLIITAFYHSYSYTFLQLLFRFIFLVLGSYVISETPHTPRLLHYIMIAYCNPFIFLQVASPTFVFSIISSICESSYICFLLIFIYYTHSRSQNNMVHYFTLGSKLLLVLSMFIVNVLRLQHTFEDFQVYSLETTLLVTIFIILGAYVWDMIVYYKQQLYRDIVTVTITLWYMLIGFVSNYAIMLGWEQLIKFVIVQIFAINLCYLVNRCQVNPKWESMMNTNNLSNQNQNQQWSNSNQALQNPIDSPKYQSEVKQTMKDKILRKTIGSKKTQDPKLRPNSSKQMKLQQLNHEKYIQKIQRQQSEKQTLQQRDQTKQKKIKYINVRSNEIIYA